MKITKATFYLTETEPQLRQVRYADRGGMDGFYAARLVHGD